jgi:hypothetical protein
MQVGQMVQLSMDHAFRPGSSELDVEKVKELQALIRPGAWGGTPFSNEYPKVQTEQAKEVFRSWAILFPSPNWTSRLLLNTIHWRLRSAISSPRLRCPWQWGQTYWDVLEYRRRVDLLHKTLQSMGTELPVLIAWDAAHGASYMYNATVRGYYLALCRP